MNIDLVSSVYNNEREVKVHIRCGLSIEISILFNVIVLYGFDNYGFFINLTSRNFREE